MCGHLGLTPFMQDEVPKDCDLGEGELQTASGGNFSDTSAKPAVASSRLIPAPESPTRPESPAFPSAMEDSGKPSIFFDKQCAPSQAPECVSDNYDILSAKFITYVKNAVYIRRMPRRRSRRAWRRWVQLIAN